MTLFLAGLVLKIVLTASIVAIPLTVAMGLLPAALARVDRNWAHAIVPYLKPAFNQIGLVFWLCMLVGVVVSLFTRAKPSAEIEGLVWNPASLRLPTEMRARTTVWKSPALWWAIVTARPSTALQRSSDVLLLPVLASFSVTVPLLPKALAFVAIMVPARIVVPPV